MKSFNILSIVDSEKWRAALGMLPPDRQDVYFTPEYYAVFERLGAGKALCAVYQDGGESALYPFLLNSINDLGFDLKKKYSDIQGAYGYNGVGSSCSDDAFKKSFYLAFRDFIDEQAIVAEFTRFNPVFRNESFSDYLEPQFSQENVILDLAIDDIARNAYEHATRKNINKAMRSGLICLKFTATEMTRELLDEFIRIYHETMKRNDADPYYFFPISFFKDIASNLPQHSDFYFTRFQDSFISAELVMRQNTVAYSFLGGTTAEYFEFRPNDLLKDFIIRDLAGRGLKYFCLGGGSAGIIKFKKSFAKNGITPFYIGKKIHDPETYRDVVAQWQARFPEKTETYKNHILKYRN